MNIGPQRQKPQNTGKALRAGVLEHTHIPWKCSEYRYGLTRRVYHWGDRICRCFDCKKEERKGVRVTCGDGGKG